MIEQWPNQVELKEAYQDMQAAKNLFSQTGAGTNPYDQYGLRQKSDYYNDIYITKDASIRINYVKFARAKTQEITGKYIADEIADDGSTGYGALVIQRDDGQGGIYEQRFESETLGTEDRASRITAIIGRRAAKRVRDGVKARAISIAQQLENE